MVKIALLIICLFCIEVGTYAQIGDVIHKREHRKVNKRTVRTAKPTFSTKQLALKITRNHTSAEAKSKAIFNWIATNIEYDNELRVDKAMQKRIYTSEVNVIQTVLKRKKALCGGYAMLYQDLAKHAGLQAEVIHGYTKLNTHSVRKNNQVNHTWNAVKINGTWKLLDITWANSHSRNGQPNTFWYGTPPADFIKTHYPENKKWALISNPISLREFDRATY